MLKVLAILLISLASLRAAEIRIDYTYDTNNFFNTQERRDAIEAVADFYNQMLKDKLLRIDQSEFPQASWSARFFHPSTGAVEDIPGLIVPEDEIIVYVGAYDLGGSTAGQGGPGGFSGSGFQPWFDRITGRGQPGAEDNLPQGSRTDHAPWGGSISFDIPRTWNFSLTGNGPGTEFLTIALHEMGHVLGIGNSFPWDNQLVGGKFTGPAVVQSFGSQPDADSGHFLGMPTSKRFGSFGMPHGATANVLLIPTNIDDGSTFNIISEADLSALVDVGWEVDPPVRLNFTDLSPSSASFNWNSVSFKNYQVERSSDLSGFSGVSAAGDGSGSVQVWADPAPPNSQAFYRLLVNDINFPAPIPPAPMLAAGQQGEFRAISVEPGALHHHHHPEDH